MVAVPVPSAFETRCNASYDALIWAMSRPGLPRLLPSPGMTGIVETLIDRECSVYSTDPDIATLAARTGAEIVSPSEADHLFFDRLASSDVLTALHVGSDLYPECGATLVIGAQMGEGRHVRLEGPGVDQYVDISISGLPDDFWAVRQSVIRYPTGFDLFLLDRERVIGVPRSATVGVL